MQRFSLHLSLDRQNAGIDASVKLPIQKLQGGYNLVYSVCSVYAFRIAVPLIYLVFIIILLYSAKEAASLEKAAVGCLPLHHNEN